MQIAGVYADGRDDIYDALDKLEPADPVERIIIHLIDALRPSVLRHMDSGLYPFTTISKQHSSCMPTVVRAQP